MAISDVYLGYIEVSDMESAIITLTKRIFQLEDMSEIFSMSRRQLTHWIRSGYIKPSIMETQGSRIIGLYDLLDIHSVGLFKYLIEKTRLSREVASEYTKKWLQFARKTQRYVVYENDYLVFTKIRNEVTVIPLSGKPKNLCNEELSKLNCFIDISPQMKGIGLDGAIIINFKEIKEYIDARI